MINIKVSEFKIKINGIEYTFRLDFKALIEFDKKHGVEGMKTFNKFLSGQNTYDCIIKILSCACVEKLWEEEELARSIPFNFKMMKLLDEITFALVEGLFAEKEESEEEKN